VIKTFINHTSSDHPFVFWLKNRLEKENIGLDIFIDDDSIYVGDKSQKMINEVKKSIIFIPVLSNESMKREFVKDEIKTAIKNKTTYLFPIKFHCDDENIPDEISNKFIKHDIVKGIIYEDFSNEKKWEIHYEHLRKSIFDKITELGLLREDTKDFYQDCEHLDLIIKRQEPTTLEIKTAIDVYYKKEQYQRYFFSNINNPKWLKYLKLHGLLKNSPKPIEPENSPGYYMIPHWFILDYLEKISESVQDNNINIVEDLLEIIQSVSLFKDEYGNYIDNYRTWFSFAKILINLPAEKITSDIIDLIPIWLDSKFDTSLCGSEIGLKLLPKFLTDNPDDIKKAEKIIEAITAIKTVPLSEEKAEIAGKKEEKKFFVDPYWIGEIFKKYADNIGKKCSVKVIIDLNQKIKNLLTKVYDGTYRSFYEEKKYPAEEPLDLLTLILKRVLLAKAEIDIESTKKILKEYINDEYLYFLKMALFVIGQNIDEYSYLFWEILDTKIGEKVMEKTLYMGDELRVLLQNLKDLSKKQKEILNAKIELSAKYFEPEEEPEKYRALHKQQIYESLSHDEYFKNLCDEMKKITNIDTGLHPAIVESEVRVGPGPSPLTKEKVIQMPNNELAEYILTFKTIDFWRGPTVGGLADILAKVAKEMPEKFIDNMEPFNNSGFIYVYKILNGIKDAWNQKKLIDWDKLFQFIELYIDRKKFWGNDFIVEKDKWPGKADYGWIIGIVTDLIQDGTRDDTWAFPETYFEGAENILFLILDKSKAEEEKEITDYVSYALNTAYGSAITALILLSLRIARVNDKKGIKKDIKWSHNHKEKYDEILNKNIIEGFTCLGRYLPNLYYLDKEWTEAKIINLDEQKGSRYWESFMQGCLSLNRLYNEIYKIMRNHYTFAINFEFKEKQYAERLVEHISIAYLRGNESIDAPDSLFKQIIDNFLPEQINMIISLFWMQRDYIKKDEEKYKNIIKRILDFWRWLYGKYRTKQSLKDSDKKILSNVIKLAAILSEINSECYKWLLRSAPYVHVNYNSSFFIEYLDQLKDKGDNKQIAKYIGQIFLEMLNASTIIPDYDKNHIISIVSFLFETGGRALPAEICNIYGKNGYLFLRGIYEKYSK